MFDAATDYLRFFSTIAALVAFGFGWNKVAERLDAAGVEGYQWALVSGGVAGTIAIVALFGWISLTTAMNLLGAYALTGGPMAWGETKRHHFKFKRFIQTALGIDDGHRQPQSPAAGQPRPPDDPRD